jgi:hypothetical protein
MEAAQETTLRQLVLWKEWKGRVGVGRMVVKRGKFCESRFDRSARVPARRKRISKEIAEPQAAGFAETRLE